MCYYKEFLSNRMIQFLLGLFLLSGILTGATYNSLNTWLAIASGVGIFAIFEYISHRYLLHQFPRISPKMYIGHHAHHKDPVNGQFLFGPVHYDILVYSGLFLSLLVVSQNFPNTFAAIMGTVLLQLYYQWIHFATHRPIKLWTPWSKSMKKKHLLHHHQDELAWFGVSNPLFDYTMGTWKPKQKVPRKDRGAPPETPLQQ